MRSNYIYMFKKVQMLQVNTLQVN